VRFGKYKFASIIAKSPGQYLRDCSAAIDRVERRKDPNMGREWGKILGLQCNDNWE
jgi:hypothetical protein